jgi:hypothetical protein
MTHRDPLADELTSLPVRPLDANFASRVGAVAKAELRARPSSLDSLRRSSVDARAARLRWVVSAGLVPALLSLAAIAETAATASTVAKIYARAPDATSK